jgi:hypothetical protein
MRDLDDLFTALNQSAFRRRFALGGSDLAYARRHDLSTLLTHARRFIDERLAPATPPNDGRQTPMRGHPVFVAQHATATCCRGCLAKWHRIPRARPLTPVEIEHIVAVIERWLTAQLAAQPAGPDAPLLFE